MTTNVAIWNPASGSAPDIEELKAKFEADRVEFVETTADDPGIGQAGAAAKAGAETVIACGGDGTIRACLEGIVGTNTRLGVLPLGTGNLLAMNLDIPTGLDSASEVLKRQPKRIDVGRVNGEAFAVMAGIGFDAALIRDSENLGKGVLGRAAYGLAAVKNIPSKLVKTTVLVDGKPFFEGRTSMVLVGNLPTVTGGLDVFPDAKPDDGLLDVGVLRASSIGQWAKVGWRLLRNKTQPAELVRRTQGTRVEVSVGSPQPIELDGEPRERSSRFDVAIEPGAIEILAGTVAESPEPSAR